MSTPPGVLQDASFLRMVIKLQWIVICVLAVALGGGVTMYLDIREFHYQIRGDVDKVAETQTDVINALQGNPSPLHFNRFTGTDARATFDEIMTRLDRIERQTNGD